MKIFIDEVIPDNKEDIKLLKKNDLAKIRLRRKFEDIKNPFDLTTEAWFMINAINKNEVSGVLAHELENTFNLKQNDVLNFSKNNIICAIIKKI